eukprot:7023971-Prymnesium_polylepis.1
MVKRGRSKSTARARKRIAGSLKSQAEEEEPYVEPLPFGREGNESLFAWADNDVIKGKVGGSAFEPTLCLQGRRQLAAAHLSPTAVLAGFLSQVLPAAAHRLQGGLGH